VFSLRAFLDFGACFRTFGFKFSESSLFAFRPKLFFDLRFEMRFFLRLQAYFNLANTLQCLLFGDA